MPMPDFFTSPYFVPEPDNWHLTDDAPEDVRKEFEEFMNNPDMVLKVNIQESLDRSLNSCYERVNEPTPNGGDYSEIYYYDKNGNPAEPENSTHCVIRECKTDGSLVSETFGFMTEQEGRKARIPKISPEQGY